MIELSFTIDPEDIDETKQFLEGELSNKNINQCYECPSGFVRFSLQL